MVLLQSRVVRNVSCGLIVAACIVANVVAQQNKETHNSREVKVTVQTFDRAEVQEFPWGWIRWLINGAIDPEAEMTFGVVYIKPHQLNPLHLHPNSAEYLHVVEGSCEHLVGSKWVTLKAGDTVRIPKQVPHQARTTDQPCRAVIVYDTGYRQMVPLVEDKEK